MLNIGKTVSYGAQGICTISEITEKKFKADIIKYYVLEPVFDKNSKIFVPIDNEKLTSRMKEILSKDEIIEIINSLANEETTWINDDNERKEAYKQIILSGDRNEIVKLIKALYLHRENQKLIGKKLHISDERLLKEAEKVVYDEFAYVLNIDRDDVLPFILKQSGISSFTA